MRKQFQVLCAWRRGTSLVFGSFTLIIFFLTHNDT
ncbi:unnamed protein product [Callosobruchus maculatus]|uniref:Uncharacterized protein n=1 Tax=Callosobruchus maculatus TaxID=64391 RepID=A0A653CWH4_CALMS|nr:unnamed protein product [Callosobruchus maculatus]